MASLTHVPQPPARGAQVRSFIDWIAEVFAMIAKKDFTLGPRTRQACDAKLPSKPCENLAFRAAANVCYFDRLSTRRAAMFGAQQAYTKRGVNLLYAKAGQKALAY